MLEYKTNEFIHETELDGQKLISCDYIQYGDYDSSCAIERANVRYLEEKELIEYKDHGGYGSVKAWILDTEENRESLGVLQNYPCFDDELVSQVETEIEDEYLSNEDIRCFGFNIWTNEVLQDLDLYSIDRACYEQAKEKTNEYFRVESGGSGYIEFKRLASAYLEALKAKHPAIDIILNIREKLQMDLPPFPINFYYGAADMLQHYDATGNALTEVERALLLYCEELESIIEGVKGI